MQSYRVLFSTLIVASLFNIESCLANEVDSADYLNNLLVTKSRIQYEHSVRVSTKSCTTPKPCHFNRNTECSESGPECHDVFHDETQIYYDFPHVASTTIASVSDVNFDTLNIVTLPEKGQMMTLQYQTCDANVNLSATEMLSVSGTNSYSVTKTDGVNTTENIGANLTFAGKFGSFGTTFGFSKQVSLSTAQQESHTDTTTRSTSVNISVKPQSQGELEFLAFETSVEVPFSATIVIDGKLISNKGGYSSASEFLNEKERTIPFRGVLRLTNVSQARLRTVGVPGAPACKDNNSGSFFTKTTVPYPANGISEEDLKTFAIPGKNNPVFMNYKITTSSEINTLLVDQPGLSAPDGVIYRILYTTEVVKPSPVCGYNDIGFPKSATYSVEAREYTQYLNGQIISQWQDQQETFKSCEI